MPVLIVTVAEPEFILGAAVNRVEMVMDRRLSVAMADCDDAGGFSLYVMRFRFAESGTAVFCWGRWWSVRARCSSHELSHQQLHHTLLFSNMEACVMAVALSALMNYLIPGRRTVKPPLRIRERRCQVRHESLLSGTVATLIFVVFQDLRDLSDLRR